MVIRRAVDHCLLLRTPPHLCTPVRPQPSKSNSIQIPRIFTSSSPSASSRPCSSGTTFVTNGCRAFALASAEAGTSFSDENRANKRKQHQQSILALYAKAWLPALNLTRDSRVRNSYCFLLLAGCAMKVFAVAALCAALCFVCATGQANPDGPLITILCNGQECTVTTFFLSYILLFVRLLQAYI